MAADWLGSIVSVNCGQTLGVYQGRVSAVDQLHQTISLTHPFHNGVKCLVPEVTFRAGDITDLKILEIPVDSRKHNDHQLPDHTAGAGYLPVSHHNGMGKQKLAADSSVPQNISHGAEAKGSSSSRYPSQATPKKNGPKNGQLKARDDECFGEDLEEIPDADFDFEGNLALFDKAAVFEEIETHERRGGGGGARSRGTPSERPPTYRHDENILESEPTVYRRIVLPQPTGKEYCTGPLSGIAPLKLDGCDEPLGDASSGTSGVNAVAALNSGLVVPSISYGLHKKLLCVAEKHGLSTERRLEMSGVCASQMALTLLGGPNRLNPKNVHQRPTVALLCGPHVKGAQGISCGRHLANHEVDAILFLPNFVKMLEPVTNELSLFCRTQGQLVSNIKDLPDCPVDLVINCLDCHENAFLRDQPWYRAAVDWANQNRAPVLSIDPPVGEQAQGIHAKWSLSLGLPLALGEQAGRVYLCDIGIPQKVFREVGINYHSPFGCKFVIPLHST
ncbi:enhancer of mRNA-decapping protein 3 isoform X2 [Ascaphus truei]|uniref:enhancer of mRNA-decapping protein 3 isoform X2 n=1 Tax=Ascaphus truei TaxID=8439 RepID=UPI003F5A9DE2